MTTKVDDAIEKMAQRILLELELKRSWDLSESLLAKKVLHLCDLDHTKGVIVDTKRFARREE